jgi:hypothetical protein
MSHAWRAGPMALAISGAANRSGPRVDLHGCCRAKNNDGHGIPAALYDVFSGRGLTTSPGLGTSAGVYLLLGAAAIRQDASAGGIVFSGVSCCAPLRAGAG